MLLYGNTPVYYNKTRIDRRIHKSNTANAITDLNINERIKNFKDQLKTNIFTGSP